MNNVLRVWQVEDNPSPMTEIYKLTLKCKLENGPSESDDLLFLEWHPKGNAVLTGGRDYMLWLMNGATGDFLGSFSGHEGDVLMAKFTKNGGKQIVSSSADKTIRVWSPIKKECLQIIKKPANTQIKFHEHPINCFDLHYTQPLVISGDLGGRVCYSNFNTGETGGMLAEHKDSVECITFCQNDAAPFAVSCGMDTTINIYNIKDLNLR